MTDLAVKPAVELAQDVCALPLARRLAALLDRDPSTLQTGDALPRGWHVMLFNPPTPQADLRADGAAHLGVTLPNLDLPRLMLGGRRIVFHGDIVIGRPLRRISRQGPVTLKDGRSGRFALVQVEHQILGEGEDAPLLVETNSYVLRGSSEDGGAEDVSVVAPPDASPASYSQTVTPDEAMLFRYSAITDNPHRIHYDLAYAKDVEGYPALLVNGSLPMMILLEMFRRHVGREPNGLESRNLAPMFCGRPLTLVLAPDGPQWRVQVHASTGLALEGAIW